MKALRQFGVLVLLLVSCLTPAMACMVPNTAMSTQERACCRMMKNQCGQMEMPASHGCCQKAPPSVHDNALNPASAVAGWVEHPDYSPQSPHLRPFPSSESSPLHSRTLLLPSAHACLRVSAIALNCI